jgi:integrase
MITSLKSSGVSYWTGLSTSPNPPMECGKGPANSKDYQDPDYRILKEKCASLTIAQFVESKFLPEHILNKGAAGQGHYRAILKHVISPEVVNSIFGVSTEKSKGKLRTIPNWPYVNNLRLCDTKQDHVQRLISAAMNAGYSSQTVKHIRNVVSAIFSHAIREQYFLGGNPAVLVIPPKMMRKKAYALSFDQTVQMLEVMQYPEKEVALFAILTDMTISQICGLQWKYVNLTDHSLNRVDELISPRTIVVRNQCYRGELCKVPASRRKDITIPHLLHSMLLQLTGTRGIGWNDFVLSSRGGRPINPINVAARRLKPIGEKLELPWLSWQVLRRTRLALVEEFGHQFSDRLAIAIVASRRSSQITEVVRGGSVDLD